MTDPALPFSVATVDNFVYGGRPYEDGSFATEAEAIAKARAIIDACLLRINKPGMTAEEIYSHFLSFGEVPMIFGPEKHSFGAYDYAKQRIAEIAGATEAH